MDKIRDVAVIVGSRRPTRNERQTGKENNLAELGQKAYRCDFNAVRVREWSEETKSPAGGRPGGSRLAGSG